MTIVAAALAAPLTACGSGSTHSAVHAEVSSVAANPTVQADARRAQALVSGCARAHPTLTGTEACLAADIPKGKRDTAGKCLAAVYAADLMHATGKARARAAWSAFTTSDIPGVGAQPCIAPVLAAAPPASPAVSAPASPAASAP